MPHVTPLATWTGAKSRRRVLGDVWRAAKQVLGQTWREWRQDRAQEYSAAVAYFAIFSMAPLLLIAIAIAGLFFDPADVQGRIGDEVSRLMGPEAARILTSILESTAEQRQGVLGLVVGIGAVLVGATGVMVHLKRAMNQMWEVPVRPSGLLRALRERGIALAMVLVVGFLLLVSLVASAALRLVGEVITGGLSGGAFLLEGASVLLSLAVITLLFAILFRLLPDAHVHWKDVWLGSFATATLFTFGKEAIGLYLGNSSVASAYGAAGSLVVLLVWVYYSAIIVFLGAEFTQVMAKRAGRTIVSKR